MKEVNKPAEVEALEKEDRLLAEMAALSSPGKSMTASTMLIVKFWNCVLLRTVTIAGVLW